MPSGRPGSVRITPADSMLTTRKYAIDLDRLPPARVWIAVSVVALLRSFPFFRLVGGPTPAGALPLPTPYVPPDWLAYAAMIRQGPELLANPFTTEPQAGRIILLFHQLLGALHQWTGADPFWLLELSRIPLLFLFTLALWRFLRAVLPDHGSRVWAAMLVFLSGGLAYVVRWALPLLPEAIRGPADQDLWTAYGWSTFEAFYNPLWIAGLTLALISLRPLLQPGGPQTARDQITAGVGLTLAWFVHPYSAVMVVAAATTAAVSYWISGEPGAWLRTGRLARALGPAAAVCSALALWQRSDPAFRAASGGFFGPQMAPVFWYPVTLAAVGFFALRGWRNWVHAHHPWHPGIAGWVGAVILLHTSNVINGYHFVFGLHLPLCIVAAEPVASWFRERCPSARDWTGTLAVLVALFGATPATTLDDFRATARNYLPEGTHRLLVSLASLPPSHVLAPADIGNLIPAFSRHRVYVGHWFMTPDFQQRAERARELLDNPARSADLRELVRTSSIQYLVLPSPQADRVLDALGWPLESVQRYGRLTLARLAPGRTTASRAGPGGIMRPPLASGVRR
jgi:hypothetical protein